MFEADKAEPEVKHSKLNDCVNFKNVVKKFQGVFPRDAKFGNKLSPTACFYVAGLARSNQDVWSSWRRVREGTEQIE